MNWRIPKIWTNREVWIIGGGPSVYNQFKVPADVQQKVQSGKLPVSYLSKYFEKIHDKTVIGVNMAFLLGDWIDMMVFGDKGFVEKMEQAGVYEDFVNFKGLKVALHKRFAPHLEIKYVPKARTKRLGLSDNPNAISFNHNSGAAAINVAVNAGATRIILLGFDMMSSKRNSHWHGLYGAAVPPYLKHLTGFPYIADDARRMGVEILNANPESAINCFPKVSVKELLGEQEMTDDE